MVAAKTYSLEEIQQMGVPAEHPDGFFYEPVSPGSRELAFFFGGRDPKKRWRWSGAPPSLPRERWRHRRDCWCEHCRQPGPS